MKKAIILFNCLILLNGCGIIYSYKEAQLVKNASYEDYGTPPPENYKELVADYIRAMLKDPESARFTAWEAPYRCSFEIDLATPGLGYCNYVVVNAKNGFGGYTGDNMWNIRWRNGIIYGHKYYDPQIYRRYR